MMLDERVDLFDKRFKMRDPAVLDWEAPQLDRSLLDDALKLVQPECRVLDVGCGRGITSAYLCGLGYNVTGIDLSHHAIAWARESYESLGCTFLVADAMRAPFAAASFDLIVDIGCFHCIPSEVLPDYVKEVHRLLSPGGYWFLRTFHRRHPLLVDSPFRGTDTNALKVLVAEDFSVIMMHTLKGRIAENEQQIPCFLCAVLRS